MGFALFTYETDQMNPLQMKQDVLALLVSAAVFSAFFASQDAIAQDSKGYFVDKPVGQLQMIVHIVGEVKSPGEYQVSDNTNVLELFSKAGGPTQFSKVSGITISRVQHAIGGESTNGNGRLEAGNQVIKVDLDKYLKKRNATSPPVLKPGDVVLVPRNAWSRWRNVSTILRDISVPVSLYFLYRRVR